ncbi:dTDP-4-dehydrorhamnose reductase [Shewanella sp. TC10]|uniref:dTDP-4-dehydrorhamnose reductase n=1 Tax=Shewanella sp. TC10 TaxID=1419739 RepID=UPI00129E436D|nr:dTDP-4-dehydrorhamnose reductase [Shewanella sp. TC10]
MKILITGKGGQLASELQLNCPQSVEIECLDSKALDITDATRVNEILIAFSPDVVINAAAYTAVDKAESDSEQAFNVNEIGAANLAQACKAIDAKLVHISTDFVFDGTKTTPYVADDATNPLGVYGASKLAGEQAVNQILANQAIIIRTAWVYSQFGNNFVKSMIRLMAEKPQLGIVYDQVGSPTWAAGLANMIWQLVLNHAESFKVSANQSLILNWTDAGVASWYDFAVAIQELAVEHGLLDNSIPIKPIPASAYPTPAKRPSFSVIDKSQAELVANVDAIHWRTQLASMIKILKNQSV